jgi:site-specific DNA-methyltransferase (adenine-specific)
MGWIFWDKQIGGDFSDGELAFTSFNRALKKVAMSIEKNRATTAESAKKWARIHPCQKPIQLYRWLLQNYAQSGWKILDTHVGSASSLIAYEWEGFDYVGFELDPDYYAAATKRLKLWRQSRTLELFK